MRIRTNGMPCCLRGVMAGLLLVAALWVGAAQPAASQSAMDPLSSWSDGLPKKTIVEFVARITKDGGPEFVPAAARIATFDNDGTLWSEQPIYVEFAFVLDRVKALAPRHPEWRTQQPFKAVLDGDLKTLTVAGEKGLVQLLLATHTGMTADEFGRTVAAWLATARHQRFDRPYTDLVYQPMLELIGYLRRNGFKTYIVSGGTIEFMRVWTERVYGIPPEHVVGSTFVTEFRMTDGGPVLVRQPKVEFVNDGAGKPVGISKFIGRRPIAAFGNSDGDLQMLQWATAGIGPRLGLIVRHTDADREWAYDRRSPVGRLDKALDEAPRRGWIVVDMKQSWKVIYPFQK